MNNIFRLKVNDKWVVIDSMAKVTIVIKSSLFTDKPEASSRTYSFTVNADQNVDVFQFSNRIDARRRIKIVRGEAYIGQFFYKTCDIAVESFNDTDYNLRVAFDRGILASHNEKNIREFLYEKETKCRIYDDYAGYKTYQFEFIPDYTPSIDPTYLILTINPADDISNIYEYNIPCYNSDTLSDYVNRVAYLVNKDKKLHGIRASVEGGDKVKFLDLFGNGNQPSIGWAFGTLDNRFLDPPSLYAGYSPNYGLQSIAHANHVIANPSLYDYVFAPFHVPAFNIGSNVVNDYLPVAVDAAPKGFRPMADGPFADPEHENMLQPLPYLYDVLVMIFQELNIKFEDYFFDDELKKLVFYPGIISANNYGPGGIYNSGFRYGYNLPHITLSELLVSLSCFFCIAIDFSSSNNTVRFYKKKDVLNAPEVDYTNDFINGYKYKSNSFERTNLKYAWPEGEDISLIRSVQNSVAVLKEPVYVLPIGGVNETRLYIPVSIYYKNTGGGVWSFYSHGPVDFNFVETVNDSPILISTLLRRKIRTNYISTREVEWIIPTTTLYPEMYDLQNSKLPFRLLFYRGLQPCKYQASSDPHDLVDSTYPMLDQHNYNYNNVRIGNYSLNFLGTDGLYENFHKEWYEFLRTTSLFEITLRLSTQKFMELQLLRRIRIKNQMFIIDEIEAVLTPSFIVTKIKCYKKHEQSI